MSVDGKMRKVPSKEEAYDMLQSLLLYYEQDHCSHAHYVGEQQTLLLPRWIHQQRQIIAMTGPTSQGPSAMEPTKMMAWMNQHQNQPWHLDDICVAVPIVAYPTSVVSLGFEYVFLHFSLTVIFLFATSTVATLGAGRLVTHQPNAKPFEPSDWRS
ncbi:hypothetical protein BGZ93_001950 [Podila epicladia]|nr:hypothetical protein BGZ93_001950 [Podila epicladia]